MKMSLELKPESVVADLVSVTKDAVLEELAALVAVNSSLNKTEVLRILSERELLGSTGMGDGIAIPHGKLHGAHSTVLAFGRSIKGIDFSALDGRPVHLFFLLLTFDDGAGIHLKTLARVSRILKDPAIRKELMSASDATTLYRAIIEQDQRH